VVTINEVGAGWPIISVWGARGSPSGLNVLDQSIGLVQLPVGARSMGSGLDAPYIPIWPGFAINTLFYAGVLWVLFCGPFALRQMIRRRRGQCARCAYPIGQSPVCTECGAKVAQSLS